MILEYLPSGATACDGLGGTVKRPYNDQIMTPRQLFDWAAVYFEYCSNAVMKTTRGNSRILSEDSKTLEQFQVLVSYTAYLG